MARLAAPAISLAALLVGGVSGATGCGGANQPGPRGEAQRPTARESAELSAGARPDEGGARPTPVSLAEGERLFNANCARCHGPRASGTDQGPPLVHLVYEPNHHGDAAFQRAAALGVRAHHWTFGDMPPVPGVSEAEVAAIVSYVRWLQREAGIGTGA